RQPCHREGPGPAPVDRARQHRRRRTDRPRAPPGPSHRREPRGRSPSPARLARARGEHEAVARPRSPGAGPSGRERPRRRVRPLGPGRGRGRRGRVAGGGSGVVSPLRRLLAYFRRYAVRATLALAAMGLVSLATVALLFLLKTVIDEVLGAGASGALAGLSPSASGRLAPLLAALESIYGALRRTAASAGVDPRWAVPLLLIASLVVKNVFAYVSEFALNSIGLGMVRDLRRDAYRAILGQSTRFSAESSSGELMSRLLSDADQIQSAFGSRLADFVQGLLTMALVLVYVFSLNFALATVVLVVAPLLVIPI